VRNWHTQKALHSFRSLAEIIDELTEEEVLHALEVEAGSRRRAVMLDKLILRAAHINRNNYITYLKEKHHGASQIGRSDHC
jgi:hypothetical protein